MTAQPDLGLVADMLRCRTRYLPDSISEQARLCELAHNATGVARTVNRSVASEASPAEQVGEDGLLLAVVGRVHFGNPIPAEWYAAARDLIRRLATPEQPEGKETVAGYIDRLGERIRRGMADVRAFGLHASHGKCMDDLAAEAIAYAADLASAPAAPVGVDEDVVTRALCALVPGATVDGMTWNVASFIESEQAPFTNTTRRDVIRAALIAALAGKDGA